MNDRIKASDWKKFKELRPLALQRYCERIIMDIDKIVHKNEKDPYERYIEIYKFIQGGDEKLGRMFDGFSRSKVTLQLAMYYDNELLKDKEIAQLSEETQDRIFNFIEM